jgi:hypothetical protein
VSVLGRLMVDETRKTLGDIVTIAFYTGRSRTKVHFSNYAPSLQNLKYDSEAMLSVQKRPLLSGHESVVKQLTESHT